MIKLNNPINENLRKLTDEKWQTLENCNNKYKVSNYGRIKSYYTSKPEGKLVKQSSIKGYRSINIIIDGCKKTCLVHKVVAEAFIKKDDDSQCVVGHLDWNKNNNQSNNLKWMTREESFERSKERLNKARQKKGPIITNAKLKIEDVSAIRTMIGKGYKQKIIAQLFCISEMQISRIKNNVSWATV